jgi:toxin ParE1/3/4
VAYGLTWTEPALQDVAELTLTLDRSSHAYSKLVIRSLFQQAERLCQFPYSGRIVPDWENPTFREVIVHRHYRLIYRIVSQMVEVVTVQDARHVLPSWYSRGKEE